MERLGIGRGSYSITTGVESGIYRAWKTDLDEKIVEVRELGIEGYKNRERKHRDRN